MPPGINEVTVMASLAAKCSGKALSLTGQGQGSGQREVRTGQAGVRKQSKKSGQAGLGKLETSGKAGKTTLFCLNVNACLFFTHALQDAVFSDPAAFRQE